MVYLRSMAVFWKTQIMDLKALTLAGPTVTRPVPDPLAVLSLHNQLYMYCLYKIVFATKNVLSQAHMQTRGD